MLGSSSSDSGGGAGAADAWGAACAAGRRGAGVGRDSSSDPRLTCVPLGTSGVCVGSGAGVSSTSECLPVVQGVIVRNSSKVRTRGLQHFQPEVFVSHTVHPTTVMEHVAPSPFCPSWNTGGPGWYVHSSASSSYVLPQPLWTHFFAMSIASNRRMKQSPNMNYGCSARAFLPQVCSTAPNILEAHGSSQGS